MGHWEVRDCMWEIVREIVRGVFHVKVNVGNCMWEIVCGKLKVGNCMREIVCGTLNVKP